MADVAARSRASAHANDARGTETRWTVAAPLVSAPPAVGSLRLSTPHTSEPSERRISIPVRGVIHPLAAHPAGRPRSLLQGVLYCSWCGARLVARTQTRYETRQRGPTSAREAYTHRYTVRRYVCASDAGGCGRLAILLEPTNALAVAVAELRRGLPLPADIGHQRAAIASELEIEILPGRPGQSTYDPRRLVFRFADDTTTQGTPLPRYAVPWQAWPFNRPKPTGNGERRDVSRQWQAIYRAAGAVTV